MLQNLSENRSHKTYTLPNTPSVRRFTAVRAYKVAFLRPQCTLYAVCDYTATWLVQLGNPGGRGGVPWFPFGIALQLRGTC